MASKDKNAKKNLMQLLKKTGQKWETKLQRTQNNKTFPKLKNKLHGTYFILLIPECGETTQNKDESFIGVGEGEMREHH